MSDRLHNLRTIDSFEYGKQLEKVKETEKWIIPIAQTLGTEYFYRSLKNECFKIKHKYDGLRFFEHYNDYHQSNKQNIKNLSLKFEKLFANTSIKEIKIKNVREYKVFEDMQVLMKNINIGKTTQGQILKVANYNIYLLFNDEEKRSDAIAEVLKLSKPI